MVIPKPFARRETARPMRPIPTTPSVARWTSCPVNMKGVQPRYLPARRKRSASPRRRAVARSRAKAPSAVVSSRIPGANVTGIPRSRAAATSMLSYPVPIVAIMRSFRAARIASPFTGLAGSVYTMSASATIRATSSAVGMGGSSGPTFTSPLVRRIASASSATGRVTTIFTSASESMPPQFQRAQTRRRRRDRRAQRAHVGTSGEGRHSVYAAAGRAAQDARWKAPLPRSHHERHPRGGRARWKTRPLARRRRGLGRGPLRRARRGDDPRRHLEAPARDGAAACAKPRHRARVPPGRHARPERARERGVRHRLSPALARLRPGCPSRDRGGGSHPRRGWDLRLFDDAPRDVPHVRIVDRLRVAAEEALLQRSARAGAPTDLGLRPREGARPDVRVRAPDGRPRQRVRGSRADRGRAMGMVAALRRRPGGIRRRARTRASGVHSGARAEDLFLEPRSERLASAYWSTSAASLRAATGIFTAQPTPKTRSLKISSDWGFQYASRRRPT